MIELIDILISAVQDAPAAVTPPDVPVPIIPPATPEPVVDPPSVGITWLQTLIASTIGGFVSGGILLFQGHLRHKRIEKERYKTILADSRFDTYRKLVKMLNELWVLYSPIQHGIEPLRWPKDKSISPEFFEDEVTAVKTEEKKLAQKIDSKMKDLEIFMLDNALVVGDEVKKAWAVYFTGLYHIKAHARFDTDGRDAYVPESWTKIRNEFDEKLAPALDSDLQKIGYTPTTIKETEGLTEKGQDMAEKLFWAGKKKYGTPPPE